MARRKSRQTGPVYYTTFQVAKYLGVSPPTVVNWVNNGLLIAHRTPGGHRRIKREDIIAFAREHEYPLSAEVLGGPAPGGGSADLRGGPPKVLVVDDEPAFCDVVRNYLTARGQFEVEVAESGFAAGLTVARFKPQVILMDLLMPDMDGFEVLRMLQQDPEMREIPVVACTGFALADLEDRVRREPFAGFIRKPFKMEQLAELLVNAMGRRALLLER